MALQTPPDCGAILLVVIVSHGGLAPAVMSYSDIPAVTLRRGSGLQQTGMVDAHPFSI